MARGRPKEIKEETKMDEKQEVKAENIPVEAENKEMDSSYLPKKDLFRIDEVADYFGVHERTIRLWIDHGKLIAEKPAGTIFISRESILKFRLLGHRE